MARGIVQRHVVVSSEVVWDIIIALVVNLIHPHILTEVLCKHQYLFSYDNISLCACTLIETAILIQAIPV